MGALAMAPAVVLRTAVCMTGRFPALAGVDLVVDQGEVVVLEGPNGAGKTSLLRLCAGLLAPSAGAVTVLGCRLPAQRAALRRRVGVLGHAAALYDDLTVAENMRFGVRAAGGDPGTVDAALERLELGGRIPRTAVGRLSAGQRRRVALALLVARWPELWLLDEPHAGLDRDARAILDSLVSEAAAAGVTVVMASHEPEQSLPLADRLVSMAGGRVVGVRALHHGGPHVVEGGAGSDGPTPVASGGAHVA